MQITRQADYAVRAVLYLAHQENAERAATSTIAKEQRIPPSFLAKIISQLSIAGLLHTSRGARGGVRSGARGGVRGGGSLVPNPTGKSRREPRDKWRRNEDDPVARRRFQTGRLVHPRYCRPHGGSFVCVHRPRRHCVGDPLVPPLGESRLVLWPETVLFHRHSISREHYEVPRACTPSAAALRLSVRLATATPRAPRGRESEAQCHACRDVAPASSRP